jgi:hypothetical protein
MEHFTPPVLVALVIAFVIGFIVLGLRLEKKRANDMRDFATRRRYAYAQTDSTLLGLPFKSLQHGRSHEVKNVLRGQKGDLEFVLFDFEYVTGSGKNRRTNRNSQCLLRSPGRLSPDFYVRRQVALFDALGKMMGGQDVNFDEDPTFSKNYVLQCGGDEVSLRRFLSQRVRSELVRLKDKKLVIENAGDQLLLTNLRRLKVHEQDDFLTAAVGLRATWS